MRGIRLFLEKMKHHPSGALAGLAYDYAVYAGMFLFTIVLLVLKYPMMFIDRVFKSSLRDRFIDLIARVS